MSQTPGKSLFPVFDVPAVTVESRPTKQRYYRAPLWDYERGDFVLTGARQTVYGTGYDAWVQWCIKTLMTERWAHLAYSSNTGIEAVSAFRQTSRKAQESALKRTITEALLADPARRTRQVRDFTFVWSDDTLQITCEVYGSDGNSATVSAGLKI